MRNVYKASSCRPKRATGEPFTITDEDLPVRISHNFSWSSLRPWRNAFLPDMVSAYPKEQKIFDLLRVRRVDRVLLLCRLHGVRRVENLTMQW